MYSKSDNAVTLVENAIHNPADSRHFMVIKSLPYVVTANIAEKMLARASGSALRVQEVGYDVYDPVVYFSQADIDMTCLQPTSKTTHCPLKGTTQYFDGSIDGRLIKNIAWSYVHTHDFDPRLEQLKDLIAFDNHQVQVIEYSVD